MALMAFYFFLRVWLNIALGQALLYFALVYWKQIRWSYSLAFSRIVCFPILLPYEIIYFPQFETFNKAGLRMV